MLYSICQRYNFESNLQRVETSAIAWWSCIRYVKDTILKAIYNLYHCLSYQFSAVFDMSKIQFWKQFTTYNTMWQLEDMLYSICQRYNFESNLQHQIGTCEVGRSCIRYVKDTILKAIYNLHADRVSSFGAVFDMSKIQFWKQFTTRCQVLLSFSLLYSICQRYNFESNLQQLY